MKEIPYIDKNGRTTLMVDGKPFTILGGELRNSNASDINYLREKVWPALKEIKANCYLVPVYWELIEQMPGVFDFSLADEVIQMAEKSGIRICFLWFGLWKNGSSSYAPTWIKKDPECVYMVDQSGKTIESISPACEKAVQADCRAFSKFMSHLAEVDEKRTVIMVQVENEIGIWQNPRDFSEEAKQRFQNEIPKEMAILYGTSGTWEEAFGFAASEYFMAYDFARTVGKIAKAGKEAYQLPMFMNYVTFGADLPAGVLPSGEPLPRVMKIWEHFAPDIDLYGPDVYAQAYSNVCQEAEKLGYLLIPEMGCGRDAASKALYTVAEHNTICFSPFGLDAMLGEISENDLLNNTNELRMGVGTFGGEENLKDAYELLQIMMPEIRKAKEENRIWGFLEQGYDTVLSMGEYTVKISYGPGVAYDFAGNPTGPGERKPDAPMGGGFVIRTGEDKYLFAGISANITVEAGYASQKTFFVLERNEMLIRGNELVYGRRLNGDERTHICFGSRLTVEEISFYQK